MSHGRFILSIKIFLVLAALDDEDQDVEEIGHINFDPAVLRDGNAEDRGSGNNERTERRARRNHMGIRHHASRNGERRRRQQVNSAAIREAAALGGALARATNVRVRQSGHRIRLSSRRRQRQQMNENNPPVEDASSNNENVSSTDLPNIEPSTSSSTDLIDDNQNDQGNEDKNTEQSNSSWEDVSEEETVGSADNSSVTNDITVNEENETTDDGGDRTTCDQS